MELRYEIFSKLPPRALRHLGRMADGVCVAIDHRHLKIRAAVGDHRHRRSTDIAGPDAANPLQGQGRREGHRIGRQRDQDLQAGIQRSGRVVPGAWRLRTLGSKETATAEGDRRAQESTVQWIVGWIHRGERPYSAMIDRRTRKEARSAMATKGCPPQAQVNQEAAPDSRSSLSRNSSIVRPSPSARDT